MPSKKVVQDIVPGERRSIRKLSIDRGDEVSEKVTRRKVVRPIEPEEINEVEEVITNPNPRPRPTKKKTSSKYVISFIIVILSIILIGIALSLSYSKAVITITPKVVNFDVNGTFTVKKSAIGDDLGYDVITASGSSSDTIAATQGSVTQTKAKGVVIVYNNYSATTQILVAGTRLATSDGLVYRTVSSVSIPGKKTTPGSIAVNVVADQAGEKYNLKLSDLKGDFKLPGYMGTDKYAGFYGRMKTDFTGGYLGTKMVIDGNTKKAMILALEDSLKNDLIKKLQQNVPKDDVLYDAAYTVEFDVPEPIMKNATQATLLVRGTAYGAIFQTDPLVKYIAGKEIKKFPSDTYTIDGVRELIFGISNGKDFSAKKGTPMIFTLKGPVKITGTFSETKLKDELKGTKLQDSNAVFAKYPSIANAYALITPFWLRSFPDSVDKINIEYKH